MSTRLYMRKAVLLLKSEGVNEQIDANPTGSANAMKVADLSINPLEGSEIALDYIRGYYGASEKLRVESYASCEFTVDLSGSGTAGSAPKWGEALLCCGFDETLLGTVVTGTAQAGGSTSSIQLAAGASAVDDYYNGLTVTSTSGANSGISDVVIDYNGTTKTATLATTQAGSWASNGYSIGAAAMYEPITDNPPTATIYFHLDGVRHILLGARGTVTFDVSAGGRPSMKFSFIGVKGTITDVANPATTLTAWQTPVPLLTSNVKGLLAGKAMSGGASGIQVKSISFDMANDVKYRQLVGASGVIFSGRDPKGSISIEATNMTAKNWFNDIENITKYPFYVQAGTVVGNTWTLFAPSVQLSAPKYSDDDGITMLSMDLSPIPVSGNDEFRIIAK